jgi:hypothetical protein
MARSSEAAGNTAIARTEYAQFLEAWKSGDASNPDLAHARNYMASNIQTASGK